MTYWAHKWLLILAVMLGGVIGVCGANATTESAGKSPVLHAMPRSSNAEKKLPSANGTEAEEKIAAQQATAAVQDLLPKDDPVSKNGGLEAAALPYEPKSQLDPFMPLIQEKPAEPSEIRKSDKPRRMLTPLEKMSLSQIKLVAVVMGEDLKLAMVEEATGKGYEVRIGTYMGKNEGQVVDIQSDRIIVREIVTDFKGVVTERFQEIKLHKADSGD